MFIRKTVAALAVALAAAAQVGVAAADEAGREATGASSTGAPHDGTAAGLDPSPERGRGAGSREVDLDRRGDAPSTPTKPLPGAGAQRALEDVAAPDAVVVRFDAGVRPPARLGSSLVRAERRSPYAVVEVPPGLTAEAFAADLEARDDVAIAAPDRIVRAFDAPNDPGWGDQLEAMELIGVPEAWRRSTGSSRVVVAVVDSGLDHDHPDFAGRLVAGWDYVDGDGTPQDTNGHGTAVAGIIAAARDNGLGIAGIAGGGTRIMPIRVLDAQGQGLDSHVAAAIRFAADRGADIVNLSLGAPGTSSIVDDAVRYATDRDVLVVAATGNDGQRMLNSPAASPGVLGVTATDATGAAAHFATFGPTADLAAPGVGVLSTTVGDGAAIAAVTGTSFAAPAVSAVAALLRSRHPNWSADRVATQLLASAADRGPAGLDDFYGFGLLDAAAALGVSGRAPFRTSAPASIDVEPNDVVALATPAVDGPNAGSIGIEGDVDWWSFEADAGDQVTVALTPPPVGNGPAFDAVLAVYDGPDGLIRTVDETYAGEAESHRYTARGGTQLVAVSNFHGSVSPGAYQLDIAVAPDPGMAWRPPAAEVTGTGTRIYIESPQGDYIGAGRTYRWDLANAQIRTTYSSAGAYPVLGVGVNDGANWDFSFAAPEHLDDVEAGAYPDLTRNPFHDRAVGGVSWYGDGRACNQLTGWVVIDAVELVGGQPRSFTLRFEQRCENTGPPLRGFIRWNADDPTTPPGFQTTPDGLWRPAAGAVPATGSVLHLESQPGDYIGGGRTYDYGSAAFTLQTLTPSTKLLQANVDNATNWWSLNLAVPSHLNGFSTGFLPELKRYPFHNPAQGGLSFFGSGRGCNRSLGWASVDRLVFSGDELQEIELRFEQRCDNSTGVLRGFLRWQRGASGATAAGSGGGTATSSSTSAPASSGSDGPAALVAADGSTVRSDGQDAPPAKPVSASASAPPTRYGPWLASTTPAIRAQGVSRTAPLTVRSGRSLSGGSISDSTVALVDAVYGWQVPATVSVPATDTIVVDPEVTLDPRTPYVLVLAGVRDVHGEAMPVTFVPFSTSGAFPTLPVNGTYRPVMADLTGDGATDPWFYAPGAATDTVFVGSWGGLISAGEFPINGTYQPFSGDFDGNGYDDVYWYAPGPAQDAVYWSYADGIVAEPVTANGTYQPFVLDLDGDGFDDIVWYAPGRAADYLWYGSANGFRSVRTTANGTYRPFPGDFDGDGFDDIFWYAPGPARDYFWFGTSDGFRSVETRVNGTYRATAGDFDGDGYSEIFWYGEGTAPDHYVDHGPAGASSTPVRVDEVAVPLVGDLDGDGRDDLFLYGVGTRPERLLLGRDSGPFPG